MALTPTEKPCSRCKKVLPLAQFYPDKRMKLGRQSHCKKCARQWHHERPDYVRRKNEEWRKNNPTYALDWKRKKEHGLTPNDVAELREKQGGRCAGCLRAFGDQLRENVDHCHATGKVRGLLCNCCNVSAGRLRDNPETLRRLATYIEQAEAEEY